MSNQDTLTIVNLDRFKMYEKPILNSKGEKQYSNVMLWSVLGGFILRLTIWPNNGDPISFNFYPEFIKPQIKRCLEFINSEDTKPGTAAEIRTSKDNFKTKSVDSVLLKFGLSKEGIAYIGVVINDSKPYIWAFKPLPNTVIKVNDKQLSESDLSKAFITSYFNSLLDSAANAQDSIAIKNAKVLDGNNNKREIKSDNSKLPTDADIPLF